MNTWRKALILLDHSGRRQLVRAMIASAVSALASACMIASLVPFLSLLAAPVAAENSTALTWLRHVVGTDSPYELLLWFAAISLVLLVIAGVLRIWNVYEIARFTAGQKRALAQRLIRRYLQRPYSFHLNRNSADLASSLLNEVNEAFRSAYRPAAQLFSSSLTLIALLVVLTMVNWVVTLAGLVLIGGAYGLVYATVRRQIRRLGGIRSAANKQLYRTTNESLQGIKEIKVLGREMHYLDTFDAASTQERDAMMSLRVLADVPQYVIQTAVMGSVIVFCAIYVSADMLNSADRVGSLVPLIGVFAAAGQRLIPELHGIYNALATMRFGAAAVDRLYDDLEDNRSVQAPLTEPRIRLKDRLALNDVSFRFEGADAPTLRDVSLSVQAGEKVGIVGKSGAGKTTLADVLLGLLHPDAGQFVVDGTIIAQDRMACWQGSVGFVPQDIFLADASVAENVALGLPRETIDAGQVRQCLEIAQATEFVDALPQRVETLIGERGVRLSGGQRQRLAIARALYHGADLLVFDEATSALDTLTEQEVMRAISHLPGELSVVLIAHRLSTLDVCDRILVMDAGKIVSAGTRDSLMDSCPLFQDLNARALEGKDLSLL